MGKMTWFFAVVAIAGLVQAEGLFFSADFEKSANGTVLKESLNAGTNPGSWNILKPGDSTLTNGVLHAAGTYGFQLWIAKPGVELSSSPSVHIEFLPATARQVPQWNQIFFKDGAGKNMISLRYNAWAVIQRWTGSEWVKSSDPSKLSGGEFLPAVLNELDVVFKNDGADIYYNGTLSEQGAPYLDGADGTELRHLFLSGKDDSSAVWYDNITVK